MSKSDLDKLVEELKTYDGSPAQQASQLLGDKGFPTDKTKDASLTALNNSFAGGEPVDISFPWWVESGSMDAPVNPEVASKATAAAANAMANGTLIKPGIEITKKLKATIHSNTTLDFKGLYLKNTILDTQYNHFSNLKINAKDVRLTASAIHINAIVEMNTVSEKKESYRKYSSISLGSVSGLWTWTSNHNVTGMGGDFSIRNYSLGVTRMGTALVQSHHGQIREGKRVFALDSANSRREKKANIAVTAGQAVVLILGGAFGLL